MEEVDKVFRNEAVPENRIGSFSDVDACERTKSYVIRISYRNISMVSVKSRKKRQKILLKSSREK